MAPNKSSSGISDNGTSVFATKRTAASTTRSVSSRLGIGPSPTCSRTKAFHSCGRSLSRSSRTVAGSTPCPSRPCGIRTSISSPRHQPATVGRSWVEVIAMSVLPHARAGLKPACRSRSNHRTRMPCMPVCSSVSWKPSGNVPKSSPITTTLWRTDSSARSRSKSANGKFKYAPSAGDAPSGISQRRESPIA